MNDCQKMVNRIFICLVIVVLAIFLTGCHSIKWEWFPKKDNYRRNSELQPPFTIKGTKMDQEPSKAVTVLQGSF